MPFHEEKAFLVYIVFRLIVPYVSRKSLVYGEILIIVPIFEVFLIQEPKQP